MMRIAVVPGVANAHEKIVEQQLTPGADSDLPPRLEGSGEGARNGVETACPHGGEAETESAGLAQEGATRMS